MPHRQSWDDAPAPVLDIAADAVEGSATLFYRLEQ